MVWGGLVAFPFYDDGWMVLMLREGLAAQLQPSMPDRPLFGWLLARLCDGLGGSPGGLLAVAALLNVLLAVESGLLWSALFPGMPQFACLVSALAISPVLVQAQLCTLMVALPCVLPVVATLAALLVLLRHPRDSRRGWAIAMGQAGLLTAGATLLSEYAVAATAANAVILAGCRWQSGDAAERRRLIRAAAMICILAAGSYLLFLQMTNLDVSRPSVSPDAARGVVNKSVVSVIANFATGCWHASLGAFVRALGQVVLDWSGKTTLLAALYGCIGGLLLWGAMPSRRGPGKRPERTLLPPAGLLLAIGAGLAPVALMGRGTALSGFGSRFLIPILPVAAMTTVYVLVRLVKPRFLCVVIVGVGMVAAHSSVSTAAAVRREFVSLSPLSDSLRPLVSTEPGFTVAILAQQGMDYELTARVTAGWPVQLEKNFWLFDQDHGMAAYGARHACRQSEVIDKEVRSLRRSGFVRRLLWVEVTKEKLVSIEPYCRGQVR